MAKRTTKSNAGREGVTASARATGQTSDQQPTPKQLRKTPGFKPAETPKDAAAAAREENERRQAGHPSAGPTPEDLEGTSFEPAPEAEPTLLYGGPVGGSMGAAGAPSAGPTPEDLAAQGKDGFKPAPEEPAEATAIATAPSAGPTPEELLDRARKAEQRQTLATGDGRRYHPSRDGSATLAGKGEEMPEAKAKSAKRLVDQLIKDGVLVPYVETHAAIDGSNNLYVLKG